MTGITRALLIIRDNDVRSPRDFARLMWPDSEGWKRVHKVGRGSSRGAAMSLAGGGFLGKLHQKGLILNNLPRERIILSDKGDEKLRQELPR